MLKSTEQALELVGLFQDAALEPDRWLDALFALSHAFDGDVGGLTLGATDKTMLLLNILATELGCDPDIDSKTEQYVESDLRVRYGLAHLGVPFACRQVLDSREWEATPCYQNLMVPHGLAYSLCCFEAFDTHYLYGGGVLRRRERPPFSTEEVGQYAMVVPHLLRAVRTQIRLGLQHGVGADLRAALDGLSAAVLLVDHAARVWFANRTAEAILADGDGLLQVGGVLRGATAAETSRLEALVAQTVRAARAESLAQADAMTLSRLSRRQPLSVFCVPLRADRLDTFPLRPTAMLFVSDPEAERPVPEALIGRLYGLTGAEARLCGDLLRGFDLAAHAEARAVSINTARTHLKNVFAKTGTARQIDLMRLILSSPVGHAVLDGLVVR